MSSPGGTACQRQLRIRGQVSHLSVLFFHPQQGPTTCPPRLKGELSLALSYPKWKQRRRDTDRTSTVPLFVLKSTSALRLSVESWPSDDEGCSLWPLSLRQGTTSTLPIRSLPPGTVQGQTQPGLELNGLENTGICLSLSCSWLAISSCILPDSRSCPGGGGGRSAFASPFRASAVVRGCLQPGFQSDSHPGKRHPTTPVGSDTDLQELTRSQCWLISEDSHGLTTISLPLSVPSPSMSVSRQRWDATCSMREPVLLHCWEDGEGRG